MTKNLFRIGAIFALTFMASQMVLSAEEEHGLVGTWDVKCHSHELPRRSRPDRS